MSSPLLAADSAIVAATGATDLSSKRDSLVTLSVVSSVLTATLSASATVRAKGVVLEGGTTSQSSTIGILGCMEGPAYLKCGGTITAGDFVQQNTDDTIVTDAGTGARTVVGVAL